MAKYMGRKPLAPTLEGRCLDLGINYEVMCQSASAYMLQKGKYTQADVGDFNVSAFSKHEGVKDATKGMEKAGENLQVLLEAGKDKPDIGWPAQGVSQDVR